MRTELAILLAVALLSPTTILAQPPTFTEIPVEELHVDGLYANMALSGDGGVAGLFWGWHVYRWTHADGLDIYAENGDTGFVASIDVSGDGSTILSTIIDDDGGGISGPAIWRAGDPGWTFLGGIDGEPPLGNEYGSGSALNHDGSMSTGLGWKRNLDGFLRATPYLWTEGEPMIGLPKTSPDVQARGNMMSGDGSVVVGWNENDFGNWRPCRWIDGVGPDFFLGEETLGLVQAISANGEYYIVIVNGVSHRWSEADGLISLGISGWPNSRAHAVSNDGVVVGYDNSSALIWTEENGLQTMANYLTAAGCTDHLGWNLFWGVDISTDGSTIVGAGRKPNNWAGIWLVEQPDPTAVAEAPANAGTLDCYPNPFNPHTSVEFALAEAGRATVSVYDAAGRHLATLLDGEVGAGRHTVNWRGHDDAGRALASGTYLVRLETERGGESRKVQLLR